MPERTNPTPEKPKPMRPRKEPGSENPSDAAQRRQDELLDEAVEETFPASDPISPKKIT